MLLFIPSHMKDSLDNDDDFQIISKSQQKREAEAAQVLGKELAQLSESQIKDIAEKLEFSDKLRHALLECRSIKAHGAHRRHLQYIGKLMRDVELEPIQAMLVEIKRGGAAQAAQLHAIEDWRERLLTEGEPALSELQQSYPELDIKHVRKLIAAAKREAEHNQPPKSARLLFRYLRDSLDEWL